MDGENKTTIAKQVFVYYVYTCTSGSAFLFGVAVNLMLIYGFYKTSRPFTIITKLFIYLSLCQIVHLIYYALNAVFATLNMLNSRQFYIINASVLYLTVLMPALTLWAISFLRFLSIYKPMYRVRSGTIYKILTVELLVNLSLAFGIGLIYALHLTLEAIMVVNLQIGMNLSFVMTFTNFILNMSSLIILRRSTNSKAQQKGDGVLANQMVIKRKKMALNTLLLVTVVQLVCTLPATCLSIFYTKLFSDNKFLIISIIFQCLQVSSFGITSVIIIWRTKKSREFYKIKCCCCLHQSLDTRV